jgi:hypothetical protein
LVGAPATFLLSYSVHIIGFVANLPNAKSEVALTPGMLIISYFLLAATIGYLWKKTNFKYRKENVKAS